MERTPTYRHLKLHQDILREVGQVLQPGARVLDFGCGAGKMVQEYCAAGYDAFGCDISIVDESERLRRIDEKNGLIPFADSLFDFVFSDQVLEHVQDHALAFAELARVLKPGGISLHIFPARLKPTEAHVQVPFAGVFQHQWWLTLWAGLGIRNSFQQGKSVREVVALNSQYLRQRTNYLTRPQIISAAAAHFDSLAFVEEHMIKHSYGNARRIYPLVRLFPPLARLYSGFYSRVILLRKTRVQSKPA